MFCDTFSIKHKDKSYLLRLFKKRSSSQNFQKGISLKPNYFVRL